MVTLATVWIFILNNCVVFKLCMSLQYEIETFAISFLFLLLIDKFTFTKFKQLIQILLCWGARDCDAGADFGRSFLCLCHGTEVLSIPHANKTPMKLQMKLVGPLKYILTINLGFVYLLIVLVVV